jgi:hypothetical protein
MFEMRERFSDSMSLKKSITSAAVKGYWLDCPKRTARRSGNTNANIYEIS